MLILTRRPDETIVINRDVEVTVLEVRGDEVVLGVTAPEGPVADGLTAETALPSPPARR